jgi:hypothetical protein
MNMEKELGKHMTLDGVVKKNQEHPKIKADLSPRRGESPNLQVND